jgi:hypothetical protein
MMDLQELNCLSLLFLALLGFFTGILSGILGIGGGLQIVPGLVYLYPMLFGVPLVSVQMVTGIAAVQGMAGSLTSTLVHYKEGRSLPKLIFLMAPGSMVGSYVGASVSATLAPFWVKLLLCLVLGGTFYISLQKLLKLKKLKVSELEVSEVEPGFNAFQIIQITILDFLIGLVAGSLGIGGAVFLLPLLFNSMQLPVKLAIGSVAGVVFLISTCSTIGKWQAGLIPWNLVIIVVLGGLAGGWLGAKSQVYWNPAALRILHLVLIGSTFLYGTLELLYTLP